MSEDEKKERALQERHVRELEAWARTSKDIVKISTETGCPAEAVATVVLMYGLNAQTHFEGDALRRTLYELFGKKIEIDPRKLGIIKN